MLDALKETIIAAPGFYIGWGGLLIGIAFGFIVYRTNFCTMGSISDILSFGDYGRFRAWLLAGAVAIVGVAVLKQIGVMDPADSMYLSPNFTWLTNIIGGLIFGVGMVFAGGCLSKNLVRAGGGDLRSLVVLIIAGVFSFMTIGGLLGPLRVMIAGSGTTDLRDYGLKTQGTDAILARVTGMSATSANQVVLMVIVGGILIYCFKDARFRRSGKNLTAGIGIGLCIVAGWMLMGLAQDEFADVPVALISLSFTRPTGDTLDYLMRFTALGAPGFGVVTLAGVVVGGLLGALSKRNFSLTTFADSNDSVRNMFGAALMGIGGVLALGCTIGQGMTGFSTLAIGSILAFASIVVGGIVGMKTIEAMA